MRYLRMLSNSVLAAMLASAYVVVLVLLLNPHLPLAPERILTLVTTLGLYYTVHLATIFYILLVARQLLGTDLFSPGWVSIGVLVWLLTIAASAGAAVMWLNESVFELVLSGDTAAKLTRGATALAVAAALFATIGIVRARIWPRGRDWCATFLVLVSIGSVLVPIGIRGRGVPQAIGTGGPDPSDEPVQRERAPRVTVIALDGASLDFLSGATSEGRLPHFGRLLDAGATVHVATLRPTSAEVVWAAVATGKLPQKNGVHSAASYRIAGSPDAIQLLPDYVYANGLLRFGFLSEEAGTTATLHARPLWSILGSTGIAVGVVGWPLTYPAAPVRGYLVSDQYLKLTATPSGIEEASGLYPSDLQWLVADAVQTSDDSAPVVTASEPGRTAVDGSPARTDRTYELIGDALDTMRPAQVRFIRFRSLDVVGHRYLRYASPADFGDVTDEEQRRFGGVLEQHYAVIDEAIGRAIARLEGDDLLLVVSPYGMEPLGPGKRLLERIVGDPEISGAHDGAPDGFLIAYGARVARGRQSARASVVDIAPTLLYYLGLPIGRDMDGAARTELFQPGFTAERPIALIPTYDR